MSPQIDWNTLSRYGRVMPPWQWAIAVVVVCIFVWLMFQMRSWFREDSGRDGDNLEMLTQFRDLHREGGLSDAEYRLIKGQLIRKQGMGPQGVTPTSSSAKDAKLLAPTNRIDGSRQGDANQSSSPENSPTFPQVILPQTEGFTSKESEKDV